MLNIHPHAQEFIDDLMNPDNQDKQGPGHLESDSGMFCCLGRLCLIAERHDIEVRRSTRGILYGCMLDYEDQPAVREWADKIGLNPADGVHLRGLNVAHFNDELDMSFAKIGQALLETYSD